MIRNRSTKAGKKQPLPAQFQLDFPDAIVLRVSDILKFSPGHFEPGEMFAEFTDDREDGGKFIKPGYDRAIGVLCGFYREILGGRGQNPAISALFMKLRGVL